MAHWSENRVSELVIDVLRDVGTDEATVAAVRVGFARKTIDASALTRIGQQQFPQPLSLTSELALRLISSVRLLSHLYAEAVRSQSEPSPFAVMTACGDTEAVRSSTAVSDGNENLERLADAEDIKCVPGMT